MSLYIIKQENSDYYKIGMSDSPEYRRGILQIGNPNKLTIDYVKKDYGSLEGWIHEKFKKYRHIGEWFEFSPEMYAYVLYYIEAELDKEVEERHEQIKQRLEEYYERERQWKAQVEKWREMEGRK